MLEDHQKYADHFQEEPRQIHRRQFIKLGFLTFMGCIAPQLSLGAVNHVSPTKKVLSFYNTHTKESLTTTYWVRGRYIYQALQEIDTILRDHRSGEVIGMDLDLLNLLHDLKIKLRTNKPFHIISGYRSPKTNAYLRKNNRSVAKKSYHMAGKAVDIRLPGYATSKLRRGAVALKGGGVGYYRRSNFIHMDTGPIRDW
jgi:uncharacterized protein YcbK (DUF882 family)